MRRPSPATLIALLALFVALGGPARAARLLDGHDIRAGSVGSRQIHDRSLRARDLSRGAIRTLRATPAGSVGDAQLADGAVTTRALAPASVLSGTIRDRAVTAADLAPSAVTAEKLADDSIGQAEIRNNAVGAPEIADQSVGSGEVIDGSLRARDVARFRGSLIIDFSPLGGGQCQGAVVTGTAADVAGADISNDLVVVQAGEGWPVKLTYAAAGTAEHDRFLVYACNPSNDGSPTDPPPVAFRYAVLGFG
jgi:hypothetical protein